MTTKPPAGFLLDPPDATPKPPAGFQLDAPTQAAPAPAQIAPPSGMLRRVVGDTAVDLGKGVIDLGESAVGLADLATGGYAGKGMDAIGFRPDEAREALGGLYSPERQAANAEVNDAKGFLPTVGAMLRNPSTIAGSVVESAPSMLAGGGLARSLAGKIAPVIGAGIGEGAVQAGQSAEQSRRTNDDRLLTGRQAAAAVGSGAVDALITTIGGKTAQKLGIADVDTLLAGGQANPAARPGILKRLLEGVVQEGVLEELPQSAQEQMWQNFATNKPLMQGVPEAAAQGALAGAAMGGPVAALARPGSEQPIQPPTAQPRTEDRPRNGALTPEDIAATQAPVANPATNVPVSATPEPAQSGQEPSQFGYTPPTIGFQTPTFGYSQPLAPPGTLTRVAERATQAGAIGAIPAVEPGSLTAAAAVVPPAAAPVVQPEPQTESGPNPALPAAPSNMDATTGELLPPEPQKVIDFLIAQARANGRMPGVTSLVKANPGLTPEAARALRSQANKALQAQSTPSTEPADVQQQPGEANPAAGALPDGGNDGAAVHGEDRAGPAVPGAEGDAQAGEAGGRERAGEPAVAGNAAAAQPEGLTYDTSEEQQDGDIGPPSGGAFTIEDAANREAARHEGGRVFPVDGGFVVRTPKAPLSSTDQTAPQTGQPPESQAAPAQEPASTTRSVETQEPAVPASPQAAPSSGASLPASESAGVQSQPSVTPSGAATGIPATEAGTPAAQSGTPPATTASAPSTGQSPPSNNSTAVRAAAAPQAAASPSPESAPASSGAQAVQTAANESATSPQNDIPAPTEAQKEAGNFKVGRLKINGLDISIEHPAGVKRKAEHTQSLAHAYGYIRGTEGNDGEHVDVFLGDKATDTSLPVFVVNQHSKDGKFDEHKAMLGFAKETEARKAYLANYPKGFKGLGAIRRMTQDEFKAWVRDPANTKKAAKPASGSLVAVEKTSATERMLNSMGQGGSVPVNRQPWTKLAGKDGKWSDGNRVVTAKELAAMMDRKPIEGESRRVNTGNLPTTGGLNVRMGNRVFPIDDLADAQRKFNQFRDAGGQGASSTPNVDIVNDAGDVVAHFSYNGRIWEGDRRSESGKEIVLPGQESANDMFARMRREREAREKQEAAERKPHLTQVTLKDGSTRTVDARDLNGKESRLDAYRRDGHHRLEEGAWSEVDRSQIVKQIAADKKTPAAKPNNTLATVRDVYGNTHRVRQSDLDSTNEMLPTFTKDGKRKDRIHRENIDATGEATKATFANENVIARLPKGAAGYLPYKNAHAVNVEIKRRGQNPDDFTVEEVPGGFVGRRKPAPERTPAATPPQPEAASAVSPQPAQAATQVPSAARKAPAVRQGKATQSASPEAASVAVQGGAKNGNTEDSGQELWANRRNSAGKGLTWDDVAELNATLRAREAVKAKVWPRPDYAALIEGGIPAPIAHVIKQVYDSIAAKPATRGAPTDQQYQDYIGGIQRARDATFAWVKQVMDMAGDKSAQLESGLAEISAKTGFSPEDGRAVVAALRVAQGRNMPIMDALFPMPAMEDGRTQSRFRTGEQGKANNALALLLGGNKLARTIQIGRVELGKATAAIEKGWPSPQEAWEKSYDIRERGPGDFIVVKRDGRFREIVGDPYKTRDAAVEAARALAAKRKGGDGAKAEAPVELRDAREGPARREANEDITSDQLKEAFGFKGINFGNWMKGGSAKNVAERQAHLNHAYDSFMDLAELLGVPPKAISLNGMLGVAFGAQGTGGKRAAAAHFVPGVNEINLTREQGAGSLAHEWAHALDHYFATKAGGRVATAKEPFLTEHTDQAVDGVRPEIVAAFKDIVQAMSKRPETQEEADARAKAGSTHVRTFLNTRLAEMRARLENDRLKSGDRKAILADFDALAERLRQGDIGEGYLATGKGKMDAAPQVVAQIHNLFREATGQRPPNFDNMGYYARAVASDMKAKESDAAHIPQQLVVGSDFAKEARKLEGTRKTPYWTTKLEMFARAFQSYIMDRLAKEGARNDYLTRPQMTAEQRQAFLDDPMGRLLVESGDRYPRGAERERINAAFDTLVGEFKTREGEGGNVVLESAATNDTGGQDITEDDLTDAEREVVDRHRNAQLARDNAAKLSRAQGEADAESRGLRRAVDRLIGNAGVRVQFIRDFNGLPADVRSDLESRNKGRKVKTAGLYDPTSKQVFLITENVRTPDQAMWHAAHEIAGHDGLRKLLGDNLNKALTLAGENATVASVADAISAERKLAPDQRLLAVEEALAELAAAVRTGNFDHIQTRYGVAVPQGMRARVEQVIREFLRRLKNLLNRQAGRAAFTDEDVRALLEHAWTAARGETSATDTNRDLILDAPADTAPAPIADPTPGETWYHGRMDDGAERAFVAGRPAFFARDKVSADWFAQGDGAVTSHAVRTENTAHWRDFENTLREMGYDTTDGQPDEKLSDDIAANSPYDGTNTVDAIYIPAVQRALEAKGFDSLIVHDTIENTSTEALVVWNPEQIAPAGGGTQTDTPAFRRWFGDSKVVGADGKPLVVYHGTDGNFDAFRGDEGHFFGTADIASDYATSAASVGDAPSVYPVFLSIKNPARNIDPETLTAARIARLTERGFDGVIYNEGQEDAEYVAFHPEQIKSATGNSGAFDPASPSILESVEGSVRRAVEAPADVVADIEAVMQAGSDKSLLQKARERVEAFVKNPSKAIANLKDETRFAWLAGLTTDMLATLGSDYNPGMGHYDHFLKAMNADRNALQQQGEELSEEVRQWGSKNPDEAKALFKLMHQATVDGVDPAKEYEPLQFRFSGKLHEVNKKNIKDAIKAINQQMRERSGDPKQDMIDEKKRLKSMLAAEPRRRAQYPTLKAKWDALTPEAQGHYVAMRDMYSARSKMVEDGLVARIQDTDAPDNHKRRLITVIRSQFETQRLQGVYFPLQRFGQYFVAAEKAGESTFLMFETLGKLEAGVKALRERGFHITAQGLKSQGKAADAPSGTFVAEVIQIMRGAHISEATQDNIYQLYLQSLPELSLRKHSIHRRAVPGFDPDAVRGFAFNMLHGAHQIARLRYAHKLADTITLLRQQQEFARKEPDADTRKVAAMDAILAELDRRHQWIMNPTDSKATGLVSSFGFAYYLGLTPAAALVNMTQTALLTFPYLAARHGPVRAMNHLLTGLRDTVRTGGHIQKVLRNDDELQMHAELQRRGTLDKTQAYNLAGIAEGGLSGHNPQWAKAMSIIGLPFHKAEVFNREASAIAAYRLAREDGKSHEEAVDLASRAVNDTHFDYCVDTDTEILTLAGWKRYDQLTTDDIAIATNAAGEAVETKIEAINVFDGEHKVIEFSSRRRISMVVTPNHECPIQTYDSKTGKWSAPRLVRAESLKNSHHLQRVPTAPIAREGGDPDFAALLGWVAAEGWYAKFRNCTAKNDVRLSQAITHNPEYVEEIRALLARIAATYSEQKPAKNGAITWTIGGNLRKRVLAAMPDKLLTFDMLGTMTTTEMEALLDAFCKGDGYARKGGGWTVGQADFNSQNLDVLQAMATALGRNATLSTNGALNLILCGQSARASKRSIVKSLTRTERTVDTVWCPTTGTGTWIARRNGAVFVTGNTNQNRARIMQSGTAKTLLMFRQYSLNMTWHMGRMLWQATKNADPEVRKIARRNMAGVLGMSALFSGTMGLPMMSVTFGILNAIAASAGGDDEPWDAETEFRAFLNELLGQGAGEVAADGALNALTGADIATRVSLSQLWFRDADRELDGRGAYYNLLEQAAGPMGGVLKNALVGKQMIDEGHVQRGIETMLPKAMKDTLRAQRYAAEGVNSLRGDPLVADVSLRDTLLQLAGFTPAKVAQQYDINRSLKNYEQHILDRRSRLLDAFAMALRTEDDQARADTQAQIQRFNATYPEIAITTRGIRQSLAARARYSADAENGITLNRRLAARVHEEIGK